MAIIKSGASSDQLTVDATSKAARASLYDPRGFVNVWQPRYSAGLAVRTATAAGTGIFFSIGGSASTVIRIRRFHVSGTCATAATHPDIVLTKTSTATSSGTPTALTQCPRDSSSGAGTAALVNYYTTLATTGTSVGVVGAGHLVLPITATFAATDQVVGLTWHFGDQYDEGIVLRGASQCFQAACGTATANAPSFIVWVEWTEE
jgi:hypothetical protein